MPNKHNSIAIMCIIGMLCIGVGLLLFYPSPKSNSSSIKSNSPILNAAPTSEQVNSSTQELLQQSPTPTLPSPSSTPTQLTLSQLLDQVLDPKPVIKKEIQRLNIKQDSKEIELWETLPLSTASDDISEMALYEDTARRKVATDNFYSIQNAMKASTNHLFSDAYIYINVLSKSGDISLVLQPKKDSKMPFTTGPKIDSSKNTFYWALTTNPFVLLNPDAPLIACAMAHEAKHIADGINAISQAKTSQEKYTKAGDFFTNDRVAEEGRGYAVSAEAYLQHAGLTRDLELAATTLRLSMQQDTAAYILTGKDPENALWLKYMSWKLTGVIN